MLGEAIAAALPTMQAEAESLMRDACEIRQPDSWATETLQLGAIAHTYNGAAVIPCRVRIDLTQPRTAVVGGETVTLTQLTISLPVSVRPAVGEVVTVLSTSADPALATRRFDVRAADVGTWIYQRRVQCVEHQ